MHELLWLYGDRTYGSCTNASYDGDDTRVVMRMMMMMMMMMMM